MIITVPRFAGRFRESGEPQLLQPDGNVAPLRKSKASRLSNLFLRARRSRPSGHRSRADQQAARCWMAEVTDADEPLLMPFEIVALTRSSIRSFRRWTASGELEVLRLGRLVRVRRSAFHDFLRKNS